MMGTQDKATRAVAMNAGTVNAFPAWSRAWFSVKQSVRVSVRQMPCRFSTPLPTNGRPNLRAQSFAWGVMHGERS
eukprot:14484853-Alexandrium_andersonii.AAC.1